MPTALLLSMSLLPNGALPKLFPTVSRPSTLSSELSPSYFPQFPFRPPSRHFHVGRSPRSSPSYLPRFPFRPPFRCFRIAPSHTASLPSTLLSLPYRSFPPELSQSYFPRFPFRPPCRHSCPQAISHGFSSVHPVVIPVSLLPTGALPKLFPTVSLPSTLSSLPSRSFPPELSPSYFPQFPFRPPCRHSRIAPSHQSSPQAISHGFLSVHPFVASVSLLPNGALPKLFPIRLPFRPPCCRSRIAPSHRNSPKAISHGFPSVHPVVIPVPKLFPTVSLPSTLSSFPYRSFPPELSPSYFPRFPFRPPCRHSRLAPSHRSSPQAISHGFRSVHPVIIPISLLRAPISHSVPSVLPVVIPVSLLPTGALPKLFPTASLPSTLSSFPHRSFPPELFPSYFPRFPFRPPCRHSRITPSHQSSPQAISHGFPSVHPVVTPVSPLPAGALPKLFPTVSTPSTLSSFPYRSFPPLALPKLYFQRSPFRPPCRHSRIAPSHRSPSHAISHGFPSVHPVVIPVSLLPTGALPRAISHNFPSVHPVVTPESLLPTGALPKLFPTVSLFCPPCRHSRIAPSHRSSPQAISHGVPSVHTVIIPASLLPTGALPKLFPTVSLPPTLSSFPYRSFPPELSPSYFPDFLSVHPFVASVSLLPNRTLPKLFPIRRHSRIAPSHRSSPQAISHGFPSVHPVVTPASLLPPFRCFRIAPSQQNSPQAISYTASFPYRSFPPELFPSYFPRLPFRPPCRHSRIAPSHRSSSQAISHGFPSVHPVVIPASLLPTGALPKLFPTASLPSTLWSLPNRSFPPELSQSYFPQFPFRPPCGHSRIAPSHRSSPQALSHGFPFLSTLSSLPYRSFPPELSPSSFPRFPFSVHLVVTPVSLLPTGALPKLFPTVSLPSTLSSFPYRSFPPELSPSYFPRFPFRPPCRHSRIAPSHRSSPQAISHGFPSVHPVVTPVSLLPTGALPKLFPTVSLLFTLSSLPSRSFPTELSPCYFPRFPLRPPNRRFHLFPPNAALPKLFPTASPPSTLSSNPYRSLAASATKREPKHRRCFWEK